MTYYLEQSAFQRVAAREGGYDQIEVTVECCEEKVKAKTFIANPKWIEKEDMGVKQDYRDHICCGAQEYDLPSVYLSASKPRLIEEL